MSTTKTLFGPDLADAVETACAKAAQAALDAATLTAATLRANVPELQGRTNSEILKSMGALRERNPSRFDAVFDQIQRVNRLVALNRRT
jgi:hypothetical protein